MLNSKYYNEHFNQLFQTVLNILAHPQNPQVEIDLVKIPTFVGSNQDPIEWLDLINRAFEANNILDTRRLAVAGAHLSGLAALWWEEQKKEIHYWDNNDLQDQSFVHLFLLEFCTPALINRWTLELLNCRQGPEKLWNTIFTQGFHLDLSLAVRTFMPGTLEEALELAQAYEIIIARNLAVYGPAVVYNTVSNAAAVTPQLPQDEIGIEKDKQEASTYLQESIKMGRINEINSLGHCYQNEVNNRKDELRAKHTDDKATRLGHDKGSIKTIPATNLKIEFQTLALTKDRNKVGKDEPKVYVSRPKFLPVLYYNEDDQRLKVETFKAQNKAPECGNQKDNISKEDLDSASRTWIS
ncbi:hypothetical protein C2G38_2168842 [Gigaspora rosea]|uniref:Retrotransposon gag domain-containing protein n=1 Tax=Gigaspora rosea TaxID=44941 RepID=A0A397VR49_9GLOM|nr:hypothetical protein C2G38_2168842 [Gigaspora rosea]